MKPNVEVNLKDKSSRSQRARITSERMVKAPVHIAIAMWEVPWQSASSGVLNGWVIVAKSRKTGTFVYQGQTKAKDPIPAVIKDVKALAKKVLGRAWVVTGVRQNALKVELERAGFQVTRGFSEKNRAAEKARWIRLIAERKAERAAKRKGEIPVAANPQQVDSPPAIWLPRMERLTAHRRKNHSVNIGTDASTDQVAKGALAVVADNGDYRLITKTRNIGSNQLEFEAIIIALKYVQSIKARTATIRTDSQVASDVIELLKTKQPYRKTWFGIHRKTLEEFVQTYEKTTATCQVSIHRILGHAGDPLNEAADKIAYMAIRASIHPKEIAGPMLEKEVAQVLATSRRKQHQ